MHGRGFLRTGRVFLGMVDDFFQPTQPAAEWGKGFARTSRVVNTPNVSTAAVNRPWQMKNVPSRWRLGNR